MKTPRAILIRKAVMFWIITPLVISTLLVAFIEIAGRLPGHVFFENAGGIVLLSGLLPIVAAHISFLSAVVGVLGLFFGLPLDRKFAISLIAGLAFGVFMLHGIYLK